MPFVDLAIRLLQRCEQYRSLLIVKAVQPEAPGNQPAFQSFPLCGGKTPDGFFNLSDRAHCQILALNPGSGQ